MAALAVVAAYAALGWWGVPALVRWQLPAQAQSLLQREASVGEVRFDPFRLRLQAQALQLRDADGGALLALDTLVADLRWSSLVRRTWSFDELQLQGPVLRLVVDPQGRLNLAQLLAALPRDPQPRPEPAPLPRLQVADLQLQAGRIDWDDRRAGVRDSLGAIELRMQDFSTLPETTDAWTLNARLGSGAMLRWRGEASWQPLRGSGELALDGLALPVAAPYLRQATRVALADGRLSARLPYRFAQADGRLVLELAGASLDLRQLALAPAAGGAPFLQLAALRLEGLDADLLARRAQAASLRLQGLQAAARRGADGTLDVATLFTPPAGARPATAPPAPAAGAAAAPGWSFALQQLQLDDARLRLHDAQAVPPVDLALEGLGLQARIEAQAEAGAGTPAVRISQAQLQARRLALQPEGGAPQVLEQLALKDGALDLAARRAHVGSVAVGGGQLRIARDGQGGLGLPAWPAPAAGTAPAPAPAAAGAPWQAQLAQLKVGPLEVDVTDAATGIATRLQGLTLQLADAGTDPAKPLRFEAGLQVREGGQLAARGTVLPGAGTLEAQLQLRRLALPIAQPLLAQHLRLKLASGAASADGRLQARWSGPRPQVRYTGRAEVADLRLNEVDGDLFARWRSVAADRLAVGTDGVDIPELRVVGAEASLIIEPDRSFNAARLLVRQPPQAASGPAAAASAPRGTAREPAAAAAAPAADPFPVRIQRVRLQDAQLEFEDLSLRPPFGARIEGLSGVVTGLASRIDARSQLELDGRVGEFGLARIRGALNPFALRDSTDLSVVFRNVDMVPASPYAMKFAGYRIAEGRISLDLRYRVRDGKLDGDNRIVLERLTLGERVDSPDALKLPLELALAILKDGDGRIDLGLPVTGDLDDPQFSYGAVIWKAVVNVLTRVVTAPFRALGSLLGAGSEKFEAIEFDPGSDRLQPPEREKLAQLAQALAKKPQLRLAVPGAWHEGLDAAALRQRAVRTEVVRRAGLKLEEGESPGPLDVADPAIRAAVRALYVQRFGEAGWQEAKRAAEAAPAASAASAATGGASAPARSEVPVWRRVGNFVQGEPQVADAVGFYRRLARQLEAAQPLPPEALAALAQRRAQAVAGALRQAGVDEARVAVAPAAAVAEAQKVVPLRLELATR